MMTRTIILILAAVCAAGCGLRYHLSEPLPEIKEIDVAKLPRAVVDALQRHNLGAEVMKVDAWMYKGKITAYEVSVQAEDVEKTYMLYPDGAFTPLGDEPGNTQPEN